MKHDAGNATKATSMNWAIEKRIDYIESMLVTLNGMDLTYFVGYWDAFSKQSQLDPEEEAGYRADGSWEYYEMGFSDGEGDRKEYDDRQGLNP